MAVFYSSKKVSYGIIFFLNFLTGVEYAVILPTALQYLERYSGKTNNQVELGLCLSAYSFSSLFSSPVMGKLSDIRKNTKQIMIIANLFQIAGSLMYFVGLSNLFIIGSRLVAGIGLGVISCTFSDIVKNTTLAERSSILSLIMVGRQIGMIIGPAFNFFLLNLNMQFTILNHTFILDKLSGPGLLMSIFWVILQILTLFFYKNLHEFNNNVMIIPAIYTSVNDDVQHEVTQESANESTGLNINSKKVKSYNSICQGSNENNTHVLNVNENNINQDFKQQEEADTSHDLNNSIDIITNEEIDRIDDENTRLLKNSEYRVNPHTKNYSNSMSTSVRIVDNSETGPFLIRFYREYIREEIVATFFACFSVFFMQTCLETMLTPFTRDYFNWHDIENSILYGVAGVDIMFIFLALSFISKKVSDRTLLVVGLAGNLSSLIFLIWYLPQAVPNRHKMQDYVLFMLPVFVNVSSLPFIVLSSISLLSKITSVHTQGFTQGLRRTVVGIANIGGPLYCGALYQKWYILIGTLIALIALCFMMVLMSFKYLKVKVNNNSSSAQTNADSDQSNANEYIESNDA